MKKQPVKYVGYVASSIDGRIAQESHSGVNWTSKEDWNFFQKSLSKFDAILAGHNTFIVARKRLEKRDTIVLTSKVGKIKMEGKVIFINPKSTDVKKFIEKQDYKKVAVIGGGHIYDFCLRHKMLDEIYITIEPFVFTNGVPMFAGEEFKKFRFTLKSVRYLSKKGTILLHYKNEN